MLCCWDVWEGLRSFEKPALARWVVCSHWVVVSTDPKLPVSTESVNGPLFFSRDTPCICLYATRRISLYYTPHILRFNYDDDYN